MSDWKNIREHHMPIGKMVLVKNDKTETVAAGYAEWGEAPFPYVYAVDDRGYGRFKATHWQEFPS